MIPFVHLSIHEFFMLLALFMDIFILVKILKNHANDTKEGSMEYFKDFLGTHGIN